MTPNRYERLKELMARASSLEELSEEDKAEFIKLWPEFYADLMEEFAEVLKPAVNFVVEAVQKVANYLDKIAVENGYENAAEMLAAGYEDEADQAELEASE